jgi:hypothetical protein
MNDLLPRVAFEATRDECIDIANRMSSRIDLRRRWLLQTAIGRGIAVGAGLVIGFSISDYPAPGTRVLIGSISAVIFFLVMLLNGKSRYVKYIKKGLLRSYDRGQGMYCAFDLTNEGLEIRQNGKYRLVRWESIHKAAIVQDDLELNFKAGLVVIRGRAFESSSQKESYCSKCKALIADK